MPWLLVPVLPLLLYNSPTFAGVSLSLPYLLIPIAAWLCRRYRTPGFVTVALGGVLALAPYLDMSSGSFGGALALYLIALRVGWSALAENPTQALIGDGRLLRQPWIFAVALILLPLSLSFGRVDLQDDLVADFYVALLPLFFFVLFLLGGAGARTLLVVGGLLAATLVGIVLERAQTPVLGWVEVKYHLDDLATLATGLGYFFAGRVIVNADDLRNPWRLRHVTITVFVLLALLPQILWAALPDLPPLPDYLGLHGQYMALPLAGLMAGYLLGYAGIGFCLAVTIVLIAASNASSLLLAQRGLWIYAEQPLFVLAFGFLGLRLRDTQTGVLSAWPARRWHIYALFVLLSLPALFSWDDFLALVKPFAVAFGAAALAAGIEWLRRRLKLQDVTLNGEGWLKLAFALLVVGVVAVNLRALLDGLLEAADDYDTPIEIALPVILVLLHLPLAYLARVLMEVGPKIIGDLRSVAKLWRSNGGPA